MPKAVNHSGFYDKRNWPQRDLIPAGPRALQSDMLPLDHCYLICHTCMIVVGAVIWLLLHTYTDTFMYSRPAAKIERGPQILQRAQVFLPIPLPINQWLHFNACLVVMSIISWPLCRCMEAYVIWLRNFNVQVSRTTSWRYWKQRRVTSCRPSSTTFAASPSNIRFRLPPQTWRSCTRRWAPTSNGNNWCCKTPAMLRHWHSIYDDLYLLLTHTHTHTHSVLMAIFFQVNLS